MSTTHTEPMVNLSLVLIRIESLLLGNLSVLELSTFMMAFPFAFTNASCFLDASFALRKLCHPGA